METDHRPEGPPAPVLVVADDESNRDLFQLVLERAGLRVIPFAMPRKRAI